jgi:hypothetical protein
MRLLLSGARLYDYERKMYFEASPLITELFQKHPLLQISMRYNNSSTKVHYQRPEIHGTRKRLKNVNEIPYPLTKRFPFFDIMSISSIQIEGQDIVRKGNFVLVRITSYELKD